jgi:hypothetical protein
MTHPLDCICPQCAQMARIWADQAQAQTLELMQVLYGVRGVLGEIAGMCDRLSQKIARSQGVARSAIRRKPPKPPATPDRRKEVARIAGLAAQASGRAHRFNSETSKAASAKRTRPGSSRMAEIGRLGGLERGRRRRERRQQQAAPPPETPPPSPETPPPSPETLPPDHR